MSHSNYIRSGELLSRSESRLLIIDVQEKLLPAIPQSGRLVWQCSRLVRGAGILNVPVAATEQYRKGLGLTAPSLAALLPETLEKMRFSSAEVLPWGPAGEISDGRYQVVVAGMETHVCVLQTVLDLIAAGYRVYVAADAVASRYELDAKFGLERMSASGAIITTVESVLFEWCEVSGTPEFKQISQLVKEQAP